MSCKIKNYLFACSLLLSASLMATDNIKEQIASLSPRSTSDIENKSRTFRIQYSENDLTPEQFNMEMNKFSAQLNEAKTDMSHKKTLIIKEAALRDYLSYYEMIDKQFHTNLLRLTKAMSVSQCVKNKISLDGGGDKFWQEIIKKSLILSSQFKEFTNYAHQHKCPVELKYDNIRCECLTKN